MEEKITTKKAGKPFRTPERIERDKAFAKWIGKQVKKARKKSGLTAEDFAEKRLGVTLNGYRQIARGATSVSESRAHEILCKIGVKSRFFAGEEEFIYPNG
jgi:transcriptional regulator with XRE-family HTH domain